jgi:hypothetical protein
MAKIDKSQEANQTAETKLVEKEADIRALLEENLAVSKEILEKAKYIKRYIVWRKVINWVILLLFVVLPIVLTIIYLPPLIKQLTGSYQGMMDQVQSVQGLNNIDINKFLQ